MKKQESNTMIYLAIALAICMQIIFIVAQKIDSPSKAAVEFLKDFLNLDKDAIIEKLYAKDSVELVDDYIAIMENEAKERGYGLNYMKSKLYDIETFTTKLDKNKVRVRVTGNSEYSIRSFFIDESHKIDKNINLIKENGKWKIDDGINIFKN